MRREDLREFWLHDERQNIPCRMADGKFALLINGPSDMAVANGEWDFGFQVPGEKDIRWRTAESIERIGNALIERKT